MRKKMRIIFIFLTLVLIAGAFLVGIKVGERQVIYNQIIYNADMEEGTYFAEYNGRVDEYYFQR